MLLFVGLELISIPTYVVLYLGRRDAFGQEATAKYFFLSILSSALLLYGFSFLYGLAGAAARRGSIICREAAARADAAARRTAACKLAPVARAVGVRRAWVSA